MIAIDNYFKEYTLTLTTLSPLAIRSGESLSPLVDYHVENGLLYRIVSQKLFNTLIEKGKIKDFEAFIAKYVGNRETNEQSIRKNNLLKEFVESIGCKIEDFYSLEVSPVNFDVPKDENRKAAKWIELNTFIKTKNKPYIPGAGIKGAIKTAILYYWLMTKAEGKQAINEFSNRLLDENNKNNKLKEIRKFELEITQKIFGETKDGKRTPSSNIKIADSIVFDSNALFVGQLGKRYNISIDTPENEFNPSFQECIKTGTITEIDVCINKFELDWKAMDQSSYLYSILRSGDISIILKALKLFSSDFLDNELDRIKSNSDLTELYKKYKDINEIRKKLKAHEALLCLGFGKSYLINSVGLAIKKTNIDFYKKIVAKVFVYKKTKGEEKKRTNGENAALMQNFPTSFYYETSSNMPLGWCVLADEKNQQQYLASLEDSEIIDLTMLNIKEPITGVLRTKDNPATVDIQSTQGVISCKVNGLKNFEKFNTALAIGDKCRILIVSIKDNQIKDAKFTK